MAIANFKRSIFKIAQSDIGKSLVIAILFQMSLTLMSVIFTTGLKNVIQNSTGFQPIGHTLYWDAQWYLSIINGSYENASSPSAAFYPLFPLLVSAVHLLSLGIISYPVCGLLINTAALSVVVYSLKRIAGYYLEDRYTWWPVILLLASPAAIFFHMFYTESLFTAIAFMAFWMALRKKWFTMGILLGLLTATRLPAILFVGLCMLQYLHSHRWSLKKALNKNILSFLLAPIGFTLYGLYLQIVRGDFFGMFSAYHLTDDWVYQKFNINIFSTYSDLIMDLTSTAASTTIPFDEGKVVNVFMPLVGLLLLYSLSIIFLYFSAKRKELKYIPLCVFGILSGIFFSLNGNLISVNRYLLSILPIFLFLPILLSRKSHLRILFYLVLYICIMFQAYLLLLFVNNYFAG